MTVVLPKGEGPGTWRPFAGNAVVTCQECKQSYRLDHTVDSQGIVRPSLQCPTPDCTWHVFARLEGWPG